MEHTPEQLAKRRKVNKVILIVVGVVIALVIVGNLLPEPPKSDAMASQQSIASIPSIEPHSSYLPGVDSGELTAALEKRGYVVTRHYGTNDISWLAKGGDPGMGYTISYSSDKVGTVQGLNGQVMLNGDGTKNIAAGRAFIQSLVLLPLFGDSTRTAAAQWLDTAYDKKMSHAVFGGVEFIMSAPSPMLRMVDVIQPQ